MTTTRTLIFAAVAASLSGMAIAQDFKNQGYLVDTYGSRIVTSNLAGCWRTIDWTPARSVEPCDPAFKVAAAPVAAAPAQVAAAPAPAPRAAVVAAAKQPVWEKVAFDANVLFDSDKSALRPAGRDKLDAFVSQIRGLESQSIMAIGYADRMGTHPYNQVLSQQRVDAVKSYLVGKGIASNRVQTGAKGETQPTTALGDCKDANNPTNVACMQPDRHVFIEVSGSRIVN